MRVKIAHLTSAHPRFDTRIFYKMCKSLDKHYIPYLIVADGKGNNVIDGIHIFDVGKEKSRIARVVHTPKKILQLALKLDAKIYHLHDPELIPIGLRLKKLGKKVIFDAHEDVPKQILAKHYLHPLIKKALSYTYGYYEIFALRKFDCVITATPTIKEKFLKHGIKSIDINNFPIIVDFFSLLPSFSENIFCYIGTLYETRGIEQIVQAIENVDAKLIIAGKFYDKEFEKRVKRLKGWQKVDYRGFVQKEQVLDILQNSLAGIVTLHPTPSYIEAYPVKMFEYLASGIGVIASDFTLYRKLLGDFGLFVNPLDSDEISKAMNYLIHNKEVLKKRVEEAKNFAKDHYNWNNEEKKLLMIYEKVLNE